MNQPPARSPSEVLEDFRAEILRWNRRINLVSRRDAESQVRRLESQCVAALEPVLAALAASPGGAGRPLHYFDLGSGNGFPGFVWHILLSAKGLAPRTWMIEPRRKRAWFLRRLGGLSGVPPFAVVESRWNDVPVLAAASGRARDYGRARDDLTSDDLASDDPVLEPGPGVLVAPQVLVSLKALRLSDPEILAGASRVLPSSPNPPAGRATVAIARFCSPNEILTQDLCRDLGIPAKADPGAPGFAGWHFDGARILPSSGPQNEAAVIFSQYSPG